MAKIAELAARVFAARDATHRAHWRARSYARHVALGEFYEALPGLIDEIVEVYQGEYGLIEPAVRAPSAPADILPYLESEAMWIEKHRDEICDSNACRNLIDGLAAHYRKTIYKLEFLK